MRKLPRRLPSNAPSLAWVGFALLLLAIGGGLAGLYTHRQNQEAAKHRLIATLKREVAALHQEIEDNERQLDERLTSVPLKLKMKEYKLDLRPIAPGEKVLVSGGPVSRPPAGSNSSTATPAPTTATPSVMAVVGRP
jgi:cell division protein FtsB